MVVTGMGAYAIRIGSEVSVNVGDNSVGYAIILDTIKTKNLSVKFGSQSSVCDATNTFPEQVSLDGIKTRKVYASSDTSNAPGDIYITLDKTKFTGSKYLVLITYYDFGPNVGHFDLCYNSSAGSEQKHTIRKTGMTEKWTTVSILIDDAAFSGAMPHGADMRIVNGAYNAFAKIEIIDYSGSDVQNLGIINPVTVKDSATNRNWEYLNFNGKPAIRPYVTAQGWNYEGTKFIFGSYNPVQTTDSSGKTVVTADSDGYKLYEYDIVNNIVRQLDSGITDCRTGISAVVTPDNYIYYAKTDGHTWKMNWLTYQKEQTKARTYGTMNVTNNGEWISGYGGNANQVLTSNTITGENKSADISYAQKIWETNNILSDDGKGHPMINPEYPHLLFFCHEGTTQYIPDRLWLANYKTGDVYNSFVQVPYSTTVTAETSGHEVWSMDGEMMYWVKYPKRNYSNNAGQSGLMRMNKFGSDREYINGDYDYWHCYPSSDHNFVAADTNDHPTKIVVVNTNTYESTKIAEFINGSSSHPNQPHPHISYNSYSLSWQLMTGGVTCIGWDEVRDITANTAQKQMLAFGEYANVITCDDAVSETTDEVIDGVTYKTASSGNGIYIDILSGVCQSTNIPVTLEVTYLDRGKNPLNIVYTAGVDDIYDLATREDKTYSITKTGSNSKKTAIVNLGNINANNIGKFGSDLYFASSDGAYISSVKVTAATPGETIYTGEGANSGLYAQRIWYVGNDLLASKAGKISVEAAGTTQLESGLQCTSYQNASYDSKLYHVDDEAAWQAAGITQETVDAAKTSNCSYVTTGVDGAWMYADYTDSAGVTKSSFYVPRNYRPSGSVNTNIYFKVTSEAITEADNELVFIVDYLDTGKSMTVTYTSTSSNSLFSTFTISGTGTGQWKTATIPVSDAKISSTNSKTQLATWVEDIRIAGHGNEFYIAGITVVKRADASNPDDFEELGNATMSHTIDQGSIASTVATVTNKSALAATAFAVTAVYNANGTLKQVAKSDYTNIAAGKTADLQVPPIALSSGETFRTFVWESNFAPVPRVDDALKINISKSTNGDLTLNWDDFTYDGMYFYNIYRNGELVSRTQGSTYTFSNMASDSYTYVIDVTDNYGRVVYRSAKIDINH